MKYTSTNETVFNNNFFSKRMKVILHQQMCVCVFILYSVSHKLPWLVNLPMQCRLTLSCLELDIYLSHSRTLLPSQPGYTYARERERGFNVHSRGRALKDSY